MDRYAHRLYDWLESTDPGLEVRLAAQSGALTRATRAARGGDLAGGRPAYQRGAVRRGPLVLLRGVRGAGARPRRLAHPGGGVRGAARGEHGGAEERAPRDPDRGTAPQRGRRLSVAGGGALHGRPGAADRTAGATSLRAHRSVRRRDHAAARVPRRRRAAVPFPL